MTAITPDLSDDSRCISVHWSLPVQCVLPRAHRANWHEAWHPTSGNRMRYRHTIGSSEQLCNGVWVPLEIPPPGGYCNEQNPSNPKVFCDDRAGHSWMHRVVYDGCTYTWGSQPSRPASAEQLSEDVRTLRARVAELELQAAKVAEFVAERAEVVTAGRNCHPDNHSERGRWQGHAEARRVLANTLGLPVAWPAETTVGGDPR